jgi:hypothetical protein
MKSNWLWSPEIENTMTSAQRGITAHAIVTKKMAITPKIAAALLEKADPRKVIRPEVIQEFADSMKAEQPTCLRLRFANDRSIVQGVHGHAIVQSGRMSLWCEFCNQSMTPKSYCQILGKTGAGE